MKYLKAPLVFGRKENDKEYLLYSAKTRGIYLVCFEVYKVWKKCSNNSLSELSVKTKFSKEKIKQILSLLEKRELIVKKRR